jgi:hypothetical protein
MHPSTPHAGPGSASAEGIARRLVERARRRYLAPLFTRLGYDLVPATPDWLHRPLSRREVERLVGAAAHSLATDLRESGIEPGESVEEIVHDFWQLIRACPVSQRRGGNGFNGALQLYTFVRTLGPPVIIESGVFRGLTTWVMRQAHPDARIFCFDPVLRELQYRDPEAFYAEGDWSTHDFSAIDLSRALAFFDDHISQARRIIEAHAKGVRHLVFDDNAASHRLHTHGGPAFPTIDMIVTSDGGAEPVRWLHNGREFICEPSAAMSEARVLIDHAHAFDDLHAATGYSPARLCSVTLTSRPCEPQAAQEGSA